MASSSRKKKSGSKSSAKDAVEKDVVDAVVIEDAEDAASDVMETVDEMADADGVPAEADAGTDGDDVSETDDAAPEKDVSEEPVEPEAVEDDSSDATSAPVAPVAAERSSAFWPLILGGLAAACLGFVFARYIAPEGWPMAGTDELEAKLEAKIEAQTQTIDGLTTQLEAATAQADGLGGQITEQAAKIDTQAEQITGLRADLEALTAEVNKPVVVASEAELSADLTALIQQQKDEIAALQGDLKSMAAFAEGQIASAQEEADAAARAEARAKARDSLNTVRLALASGDGFEDALAGIAGAIEVPEALSAVAGGVVTQSDLQGSFGPAARTALAAANRELSGDSAGDRLGLFFQDMIGARSLTPQDGDSPDAVLSRVEAAVKNGDLAGALTEIDALPETGKAALNEWSEKARARDGALQAFSTLTDALSAD